jgi:general secretion pathway protein B
MSYILEALKKSQQERELGQVPTLATESYSEPERPSKINPLVLSALLLAFLAIVVALYALFSSHFFDSQQRQADTETVPASTPPSLSDRVIAAKPVAPSIQSSTVSKPKQNPAERDRVPLEAGEEPAVELPDRQAGQKEVVIVELEQPAPAAIKPPVPLTQQAPSAPAVSTGQDLPAAAEQPLIPPVQTPGAEHEIGQSETAPTVKQEIRQELLDLQEQLLKQGKGAVAKKKEPPKAVQAAVTTETTFEPQSPEATVTVPQHTAEATNKPPPISENALPPDVFKRLPARKVSALAYSKDPERRFILLNSQKMREGEGTKEALVIEEILPDGVIFRFEDHRFFTSP